MTTDVCCRQAGEYQVFDEATHTYYGSAGQVLPGVTGVLKSVGIIDDYWYSEIGRWRGSAVHKLCELYDQDCISPPFPCVQEWAEAHLEPGTFDEKHLDCVPAWIKFRTENDHSFTHIEQPLFGRFVAGKPDRIGIVRGSNSVIDIKTGALAWWTKYQLAPYADLAGVYPRIAVRLQDNGKYTVTVYPVRELGNDLRVFRSSLQIHTIKEFRL